jgi:hypothetical protein
MAACFCISGDVSQTILTVASLGFCFVTIATTHFASDQQGIWMRDKASWFRY